MSYYYAGLTEQAVTDPRLALFEFDDSAEDESEEVGPVALPSEAEQTGGVIASGVEWPGAIIGSSLVMELDAQLRALGVLCEFRRPQEVASFLLSNSGLIEMLPLAIVRANSHMQPLRPLQVEIVRDPESEEEWLTFNVEVAGDDEDVLARYGSYVSDWVRLAQWPEVNKIRLSYDATD